MSRPEMHNPNGQGVQRACDRLVFAGLGTALVFAPLAFGAVHAWACSTLELLLGGCAVLWCVRTLADAMCGDCSTTAARPLRQEPSERRAIAGDRRQPAAWIAALALAAWVLLSIVPLPPPVLRTITPATYALLAKALPGWPETAGYASVRGDVARGLVPATWRPMALSPFLARTDLLRMLAYGAALLIVAYYPWADSARTIRRLLQVLITVAVLEASYFFLQESFASPNIYWFRKSPDTWLPAGTYINRDHFAGLLAMLMPVAGGMAVLRIVELVRRYIAERDTLSLAQRRRGLAEMLTGKGGLSVALWVCVTSWLFMALYRSLSRGGFLSPLIVGCLFGPLLLRRRRTRAQPLHPDSVATVRSVWMGPTALLLGLGVFLVSIDLPELAHRLGPPEVTSAAVERSKPLRGTLAMIADFPLFGVGPGNFEFTFPLYRDFGDQRFTHVHDDYLEVAAEMGLPALALAGVLIVALYRRAAAACVAAVEPPCLLWGCVVGVFTLLLHSVVDFNLHIPANALVFAVLTGIVIRLSGASHVVSAPRRPAVRVLAAGAAMAALLVIVALDWRPARVEAALRSEYPDSSLRSLVSADAPQMPPDEQLHRLEVLATSAPENPFLQYVTGFELQRQALSHMSRTEDEREATALLARAAGRYVSAARALPQASGPHLQLGILGVAGVSGISRSQAIAALARARQLDPFDPTVTATVAVLPKN